MEQITYNGTNGTNAYRAIGGKFTIGLCLFVALVIPDISNFLLDKTFIMKTYLQISH